jgi:predicted amidohydrolase
LRNGVTHYDKIHLCDITLPDGQSLHESKNYHYGDKAVVVGNVGLTICYDLRFPHLFRTLAKQGAEIIAVPSAFTKPTGDAHWHTLLRARAIENGCYIIAPAQTGNHPANRQTFGHALIVDPWGEVIADAGEEVGIVYADFNSELLAEVRGKVPSLQHDRPILS